MARTSARYTRAGTYYARLTVIDIRDDVAASETVPVTVENVPPDARLQADFTAYEDDVIWFRGNLSYDTPSDRQNLTYEWDFGDQTGMEESSEGYVSHSYTQEGVYKVGLKVWDTCAPQALLEAAGGRMGTLSGGPLRYAGAGVRHEQGMLATHASVFDEVAAKLQSP